MRRENRIVAIVINWNVIKEFLVDKIKGLPKDVEIIGIRHEEYQMYDTIGLYSKEFDKVPDGVNPETNIIKIKYKTDKKNRKSIIDGLEYVKNKG